MTLATFSTSKEAQQAAALLNGYRFELGNHDAAQWVSLWIDSYRPVWVRDAVIEALYQGRYKAFSVRQILELWQKREKPIRHTTRDFEATVCQAYGGVKLAGPAAVKPAAIPSSQLSGRLANGHQGKPARQKASLRTHQSLSAISFNLSEQPPIRQQIGEPTDVLAMPVASTSDNGKHEHGKHKPGRHESGRARQHQAPFIPVGGNGRSSRRVLIETAETLRWHSPFKEGSQRQVNGMRYSPGRAIQPFKPALPFSAQTLRLAKQKALATADAQ